MLSLRYNLNGDDAETLMRQLDAVRKASKALQEAIGAATPHGRNYQTVEDGEAICTEDRRRMAGYWRQAETIANEAENTMLALLKDDRVRKAWTEMERV